MNLNVDGVQKKFTTTKECEVRGILKITTKESQRQGGKGGTWDSIRSHKDDNDLMWNLLAFDHNPEMEDPFTKLFKKEDFRRSQSIDGILLFEFLQRKISTVTLTRLNLYKSLLTEQTDEIHKIGYQEFIPTR